MTSGQRGVNVVTMTISSPQTEITVRAGDLNLQPRGLMPCTLPSKQEDFLRNANTNNTWIYPFAVMVHHTIERMKGKNAFQIQHYIP